jgi:hypothetical protein
VVHLQSSSACLLCFLLEKQNQDISSQAPNASLEPVPPNDPARPNTLPCHAMLDNTSILKNPSPFPSHGRSFCQITSKFTSPPSAPPSSSHSTC